MFSFDDIDDSSAAELAGDMSGATPVPVALATPRVIGPGSRYVHRWALNIQGWRPVGGHTGSEFQYLLGLIKEEADRKSVMCPRQWDDKKRALISRLMVRQASAVALDHATFEHITIKRTKGKKPYLFSPLPPESEAPNWNVSVSHEGAWVVCVSEPLCVVGVDVAELRRTKPNGVPMDFYRIFAKSLTEHEWSEVRRGGETLDKQYETFSRYWSAKEAFTKARGDGLVFDVGKAEFHWRPLKGFAKGMAYEGDLFVEGSHCPLWRFVQHKMPEIDGARPHWVTVGRGPVGEIKDAWGEFTRTMRKPQNQFQEKDWSDALAAHSPTFDVIPVSFLIPNDAVQGYVEAVERGA